MQIQKFGLEIRKIGNLDNLYSDVDLVLKNNNIPNNGINITVQQQSTAHALQHMLSVDRWCDICAIQECAKLCQICISEERMLVYHSQHCIHWNKMLPEFRQLLVAMILDDFRCVLNPA
jgi:hypothetical protein